MRLGSERDWRRDALIFVATGAAVTLLFTYSPLDLLAARMFFSPGMEHWPVGGRVPCSWLYAAAPWITASLVLAGVLAVIVGVVRRSAAARHGAFVLLSLLLGPGLLINGVFKDHWDRPRPRDIAAFGGAMAYVPAPMRGPGGASFPCGHCAVGFLYGTGWWIWRRRHPAWALVSLALGLLAGGALGVGRMAAGGHFLSDVIWSALLALGLAHALYHYVLRIPEMDARDDAAPARGGRAPRAVAALALLGGLGILLALFASPHGVPLNEEIALDEFVPRPSVLDVRARSANIEITVIDSDRQKMSVRGELHGFGLPGSRLGARVEFQGGPMPTLHYLIEQRGWFTDLNGFADIQIPVGGLRRIRVQIGTGNIRIANATHRDDIRAGRLHLELHTANGHVQVPGG